MLSFLKREKSKKLENQLNTLQKEGPAAWADLPEDELFTPAGFHAEQAEAHDQQTRHGAGLEGHVEGGGHALAGGFSGTDVGTHGNVHADVAGDAGQHRAKHEAQRHKAGKGPSQKHGHDHAHDGDGFVLTVQVRLSALLNSAGNLLHFFRAGTGGEDALGGIIRIVEGEQPASQYHDE